MPPVADDDPVIDLERQPTVFLVATSHLDTQWRWTVEQTIREFLPATVEGNAALFGRFPSYVLSFEGAFRYMLIREYHPRLWRRLVEACAAGRWAPAGAMLDSPDVNIPSPESLVRQVLYGNGFFRQELGRPCNDFFLPDCFGFGSALPSIAAHCGIQGFSSQKFIKWMAPAEIPFDLGYWRGPDGRGVVAALNPDGYGDGIREDLTASPRLAARIERLRRTSGLPLTYMYFGTGDQGGPLDEASLQRLESALQGRGAGSIRVVHGPSDALFGSLTPQQLERLPPYRGELLLPRHGTGGLTSVSFLKRANRKNERRAAAAESAAALASWVGALPYPAERLRSAWIRFLWHQQHDGITGTSIPRANRIAANDHAVAENLFTDVLDSAAAALARVYGASEDATGLLVFNPAGTRRQDIATVWLAFDDAPPDRVRVTDAGGKEVRCQILRRETHRIEIAILAEVPPLSFARFQAHGATATTTWPDEELRVDRRSLENHRYRIEIDDAGNPSSVYDKLVGRELLAGAQRLELLPDSPRRWPAWEIRFKDLAAAPLATSEDPARITIEERGPARVALAIERRLGRSRIRQWIRLGAEGAGERIEVETLLEWRERGALLKASFPLAAANRKATFDLGLGAIERENASPVAYEVPAQQWADISHADGSFGVSVLSDARCGWNKPDDRTLRLSLVRSPKSQRRYRHHATQDHGSHRIRYGLYGHRGDWSESDVVAQAAALNQPLLCWQIERGRNLLDSSPSLVTLSSREVSIEAVKRPEASAGERPQLLVRLRETSGRRLPRVALSFPAPALDAQEVTGCEEPIAAAEIVSGEVIVDFEPFALRSLLVTLAAPLSPLPAIQSAPVTIPFDHVASSFHGKGAVRFDRRGRSIPGELLGREIDSGGVRFTLGPLAPGEANALRCRGQRLELPEGPWRSVHLLACAVAKGRRARAEIKIGDLRRSLDVGYWSGWLAMGPDELAVEADFSPPSPAPIAWLGTHCHDRKGRDIPYRFSYLFRYDLALPKGARHLVLPSNQAIRLFALSMSDRGSRGSPGSR